MKKCPEWSGIRPPLSDQPETPRDQGGENSCVRGIRVTRRSQQSETSPRIDLRIRVESMQEMHVQPFDTAFQQLGLIRLG